MAGCLKIFILFLGFCINMSFSWGCGENIVSVFGK